MVNHARVLKDEIVIGGMLILLTFVCLSIFSVVELRTPFDPMNFGTGAGAILAAIGGGQGIRDWLDGKAKSYVQSPNTSA